jgi:Protein of unknown function (DUF1059)
MGRKIIDCRDYDFERTDGGGQCTIVLAGEEAQLFAEAIAHARFAHGMEDTAELHELIRGAMRDEAAITA